MTLSRSQRETILAKIQKLVAEKYFDPKFDDAVWNRIVDHHRSSILDANDSARRSRRRSPRCLRSCHRALSRSCRTAL